MTYLREHGLAFLVVAAISTTAWMFGQPEPSAKTVTIPFGRGTSISGDGRVALERTVTILRGDPAAVAEVSGHTWPGSDAEADLGLARQRARHVADELAARGIADDRVEVAQDGHVRPLAGGCDADWSERDCRLKHARAEVRITRGR